MIAFLAMVLVGTTLARSSMPDILMEREETNDVSIAVLACGTKSRSIL